MARNIAIRKLARRLGRPAEELLRTLTAMGHERFASPDDVLPGELAERLAVAVNAPRPQAGGEDFEALMRAQGVERLDGPRAAVVSKERRAEARAKTTRAATRTPGAARRPRHPPSGRNGAYADELERVLAGTRQRLEHLERELSEARDERRALAADSEGRLRELEQLLAAEHRAKLAAEAGAAAAEQRLTARSAEDAARPSLRELLAARGLKGEDEEAEALVAVLRSHRLGVLDASLAPVDVERLRELLDERLVLHCGREGCPVPGRLSPVLVAEDRCEVCGGSDMNRAFARLSAALMLNGLRRVTIVGGSVGYHRHLRRGLDERVQLKLVEGTRRRSRRQAKRDLADSQLLVVWGDQLDEQAIETLYGEGGVRLLRAVSRSLGGMLRELAEALER